MIKHQGNIIKAIKALKNNSNNAVAYIFPEPKFGSGLLAQATVTLKDIFATKNAPTQASSFILKNFIPAYDATIVTKLKEQGAALLAKTHLDELALGGTGTYSRFGKIHHPLDPLRLVGGSSSGSAATFDQNISIALASDTGDSVRLPASYNGFVGFKPSYGAVSRYGVFAFASSLDTVGWFSHNVADAITMAQVGYGFDSLDFTSVEVPKPKHQIIKPQKVAILDLESFISKPTQRQLIKLKQQLETKNIIVEKVKIDASLLKQIGTVYQIISYSEASSNDSNLTGIVFGQRIKGINWQDTITKTRSCNLGYMVQRRFALGAQYLLKTNQKEIFLQAQKVRRLIVEAFNKIYHNYDVLIYPSTTIAPKISDGKANNLYSDLLAHANLAGSPSITIPFTQENNLPIGLSLDTFIYNDQRLLSMALYLEKLLGGQDE